MICGVNFKTVSKTQKYCSYECSGKSQRTGRTTYEKVCPYCNKTFTTINKNHEYCSSACGSRAYGEKIKRYKVCKYCGNQFYTDHYDRYDYCSRECSVVDRYGTREERIEKQELIKQQKLEERAMPKICLWCGGEFTTRYEQRKYCSDSCSYEHKKKKDRDEWADTFKPKEFSCMECGGKVITTYGNPRSVYCSDECQYKNTRRLHKGKRKEQMKEAYRSPVSYKKIYKRDKGICGICGMYVPDDKDPSGIWTATIDHIVPLSKGGTHEPANCQLAHRLCNSIKLDAEDEYTFDWLKKNKDDNGRWTEYLELYFDSIYKNNKTG